MLTILFVLFTEISNIFGQLIAPNNYDSATQTEIYNMTSSSSSNYSIDCGAVNDGTSICIISCTFDNSCSGLTIDASSVQYLELNCLASEACHGLYVNAGPMNQADINCQSHGGRSCYGADFTLTNTSTINVVCDNSRSEYTGFSPSYGSCYDSIIRAANADQVNIDCVGADDCKLSQIYVDNVTTQVSINGDGEYSLGYVTIYGSNTHQLNIACNNAYSCRYATIYPPSQKLAYAFKMYCVSIYTSCDEVDIIIPSSTLQTTNYMELICPLNGRSTTCDIRFDCQDLLSWYQSYQTETEWSSELLQYECDNQYCCPWTDPQDMVQNTTTNIVLPNSISPTMDNGTHQYYNISNDGIGNKQISCNATEACYILCGWSNSCLLMSIYAGSTKYLQLDCLANESCVALYISQGPTHRINISCNTKACRSSDFILTDTAEVNIVCSGSEPATSYWMGSCDEMNVRAENADRVTISCLGEYSCVLSEMYVNNVGTQAIINGDGKGSLRFATIYGSNANQLDIGCNNEQSCYYSVIYPPSQGLAYVFTIYCIAMPSSCHRVDIIIPSSTAQTTNYMELICPLKSIYSVSVCDIQFQCEDLRSSYQTETEWSSSSLQYECDNQYCCPWTDPQDMVQNTTINTILPNSITPTVDNGTHEYYNLSNDGVSYKQISCTASEFCYILCVFSEVCKFASIYAGLTKYLQIDCLANAACDELYITEGPTDRIDINCITEDSEACHSADFLLTNTAEVNIVCSGTDTRKYWTNGNCYGVILQADNAENVTIDCEGFYDCQFAKFYLNNIGKLATINANGDTSLLGKIYASEANKLNVNCGAESSCSALDVYPPYSSQYGFKMECSSAEDSCNNVDLHIPSSVLMADNWMELICPSTNSADGLCDIDFYCQDLSTLHASTSMIWQNKSSRYECDDHDCCPWPIQQLNAPSVAPTINTESDSSIIDRMNYFIYFFIIFPYLYF